MSKRREIVVSTDALIEQYINEYAQCGNPIRVNFRTLVPELNRTERYTHLIHSYPAKLLSHFPYFFLSTDIFCPPNGTVLDPFCGTGTVLLEAMLAQRKSYGADANPLAVLITLAKTTYISKVILSSRLESIICNCKKIDIPTIPIIGNVDMWFSKSTTGDLARLISSIDALENRSEQTFFKVCFSNLIKKVSYADPRISVPVKLNPERFSSDSVIYNKLKEKIASLHTVNVIEKFEQLCKDNIERVEMLHDVKTNKYPAKVISDDARKLSRSMGSKTRLPKESVDLILTSPPYAGAQKYIRSSSLNLGWLGIASPEQIRRLDAQNIGRENYRKAEIKEISTGIVSADQLLSQLFSMGKYERAYIVGNYINEMKIALDESIRVLKKGGYFIMVIGNNNVCGLEFNTQEYLSEYIISKGLSLQFKLIDDIKSYGLMTKRNKTADRISCEWVLVFKK